MSVVLGFKDLWEIGPCKGRSIVREVQVHPDGLALAGEFRTECKSKVTYTYSGRQCARITARAQNGQI